MTLFNEEVFLWSPNTTFSVQWLDSVDPLSHLFGFYKAEEVESVVEFLKSNRDLGEPLAEAQGFLRDAFPSDPVFLRVYLDPEGELDDELAVNIRTSLPPREALDRMDRFDEAWWYGQLNRFAERLSFNIEYR